jgi:hypothetical protein
MHKMTIQYFLWQYMLLNSYRVIIIIKKLTVLYTKSNVENGTGLNYLEWVFPFIRAEMEHFGGFRFINISEGINPFHTGSN